MRLSPLLLSLLIVLLPALARSADDAAPVARAHELRLDTDPQWLALLHLNRGGTLHGRGRSYVRDPSFFLAPDGDRDPRAELDATVHALFVDADPKARCRFVARYRWLAARLGQSPYDPLQACPDYAAWRTPMHADRVTLVFPGSYLNSPSSMFGHTLLRIDPPPAESSSVLLSWAVSFGAEITPGDNSLLYVWKGLAGGYPGHFNVDQYFSKIQQYGRMENRDLWEYPLGFTPDETGFLVDHLWELHNARFDYYFFDENCSYRLLELLEVARPSLELTRELRLSEVPVNTIRRVAAAGVAGTPQLRPSAERELRARVAALDDRERELALRFAEGRARTDEPGFVALPRDRQAAVLAAAYARIVYRSRQKVGRDPVLADRSLSLLRALNASGEQPAVTVVPPAAPEQGHLTRRVWMGGGARDDGGLGSDARGFAVLGWRPSYHDVLDPPAGYLRGAELEILDTELRLPDGGSARLERLDVARVFSLTPRDSFFPNWSWRVRGGLEREPMPGGSIGLSRYLEGGGGVAFGSGNVLLRAFAEARVEYSGAHDHLVDIATGPALGLYGQYPRLGWSLDARPLFFSEGFRRTEARLASQWQMAPAWGLRAELRWRAADGDSAVAHRETTDADILLEHYF